MSDDRKDEYDAPRPGMENAPAGTSGTPGSAPGHDAGSAAGGDAGIVENAPARASGRDPSRFALRPTGVDAVATEMGALFAAALEGEPPSTVTAESVLREARAARAGSSARARFLSADWFAEKTTAWKWGGGLAVAAAAIGTVIVMGPMLGGGSATSADMAVAGGALPSMEASSESGGDSGADSGSAQARIAGDLAADSSAAAAGLAADAAPLPADAGAGGAEAYSGESAQSAAESPQATADPAGLAAGDAAGSGNASGGSAGGDAAGSGDQMGPLGPEPSSQKAGEATSSAGQACALDGLTQAEWFAAVSVLPSGITAGRLPGVGCQPGALRGNGLDLSSTAGEPEATVWIVISDRAIGRDGAADNSVVVSAVGPAGTVTAIANQYGPRPLGRADLQRLVDAVARAG